MNDVWCDVVTEREVRYGMLQSDHPNDTSFCITRCITNLMDNLHQHHAHTFIDVVPGRHNQQSVTVDVDAQQMLAALHHDKIASVLSPHSIAHFDIDWENPEETNPNEDEVYLSRFMDVFERRMMELIESAVALQRSATCDPHVVEILQHLTVCRQRSQVCLFVTFIYM